VNDVLLHMRAIPQNFNTLSNFPVLEFDELCELVVPVIASHAWCMGEVHKLSSHPLELTPQQRILNFLPYMKHDNITTLNSTMNVGGRLACN
jgi:hypothetical protein